MPTLKELAASTGYSPATISRILTGDPELAVSDETRRRVLEAAGRTNYAATKSRRGRTPKSLMRLGLAEMLTPAQQLEDPYYLYLRNFVEQACLDQRFTLVPLPRRGELFGPPEGLEVDGVVAVGIFSPAQIDSLAAVSRDLVFLNSSPEEDRFDSVVLNLGLGIELALDHLLALGHRRIGYLGPVEKLGDRREPAPEPRRGRFVATMAAKGLLDPALLLDCPMDAPGASRALEDHLARGQEVPTALVCANEEVSIGALRALALRGLSVPAEVSLVSFNDTPRSALVSPALTSVSAHVEEMSRAAVRLAWERGRPGGRAPIRAIPVKVVVPPALTVRESTAPPV